MRASLARLPRTLPQSCALRKQNRWPDYSATEILEILKRLNEDFQKTIVMVTHDPHAASYAHATRHLEKGMLLPEVRRLSSE